jgi:3-oxoacyl-[acyl-carrier protein] reductase
VKLDGKVALVTGASRGIGRAIALTLATAGAFVYVNYSASSDGADKTVSLIEEQGGKGKKVKFDVSRHGDVEESVKGILEASGEIDILVNNAGIARDTLLMRVKEEDLQAVFDINLKGVLNCTRFRFEGGDYRVHEIRCPRVGPAKRNCQRCFSRLYHDRHD